MKDGKQYVPIIAIGLTLVATGWLVSVQNNSEEVLIDEIEEVDYSEQKAMYADEQKMAFASTTITDGIVEVDFTAEETELILDDVVIDAWTYTGDLPGQEIRIQHGQTLRLNLTNNLDESTTIHWHGVRVENAMDGVPGVTQEAVEPGETFTYEITPKDPGTYWFHPHYNTSEQIERGLYYALIVEDSYADSFTRDETWVIDDWKISDGELYEQFNTMHDLSHDGRWGNLVTINGTTDTSFSWNPGERIRLRIVNAANARVFKPDFGDLQVDVIAFDGISTFGSVDYRDLDIASGNRVDLAITIPDSYDGSVAVQDVFTRNTFQLAEITIGGQAIETPEWNWETGTAVTWNGVQDLPADESLVFDAVRGGEYGISWMLNGEAFPEFTPIKLSQDEFTVIEFVNNSGRLHPMHLHGQFFRVVSADGEEVSEPFWRDTVLVYPKETVRIALAPSEVGDWALHCHILEHAAAGMLTIVSVE
jgi:FtsP/CotA-like multicopper oxidase with cupredoxin domain